MTSPIALSNLALTSLASDCHDDAEKYWHRALRMKPAYFEAAEHLISLHCRKRRHKDAVQVVDYVRRSLRASGRSLAHYFRSGLAAPEQYLHEVDITRLLGLIHAKGNILYLLHDQSAAGRAFEEVLSLSFGLECGTLHDFVQSVLDRLAIAFTKQKASGQAILLTPQQALSTIYTCFGHVQHLPGLQSVSNLASLKTAFSITSSALLSLAKILQDALLLPTPNIPSSLKGFGTSEILALYYLSLSILPSPSTANNVGILLAGNQPSVDATLSLGGSDKSGLALQYYQYGLSLDSKHAHL